jgi:hypothetical protein
VSEKTKAWCPVCGKITAHKKLTERTTLLVFSGELVDGVPVQPDVPDEEKGCPYWRNSAGNANKHCTIHQSNHHFEVSPEFNDGQPVKRVPDNLSHQVCREPREGELVCCECLEAAETGVSVMDLQKESGDCDRRLIYIKAASRHLGRRYVTRDHVGRPERRFTCTEADIIRVAVKQKKDEPAAKHDDPCFCHSCGTRVG